ncbi:hypothetical protein [Enterovirga sp.]|mgnify:CR=1 FL=1|uniref:hypothetical protein n=1 Tax=Enterovirga sp. TaxID=2026350 RepID=UPI002CBD5DF6|nr:hypothetical protein [Enterovirga sp.]HMO29814.1 hypothetical protein [Enterovirga sp.]
MTRCLRLGLAGVVLAGLGACSFDAFTYTVSRYGTVRPVNVTLRCRDTYEVLDRPEAMSLLVGTNPLNEALVACIDGGPDVVTRQREVARIFLTEKTERPLCRITEERDVNLTHREFFYSCPDDPKASPRLRRGR